MIKRKEPYRSKALSTCGTRFELATFWSVARRSIQLSYPHILLLYLQQIVYYNG